MHLITLLLLSACGPDELLETADPLPPTDPIELGRLVSETELRATIEDLVAFGTRHTDTTGSTDTQAYLTDRLEQYGYLVEKDDFSFNGHTSANVIARKEGAIDPDVVWIFSAHYDSTSPTWQTSAPGADDNASAVAVVLEAARLLASEDLRYGVWFVFTGAEEQGSRGSAHMADWLADETVEVRGVMAPDMIGYWPLGEGDAFDILGDDESEHLVTQMATIADELGVAHKTWIHHDYCYGDDHTNFQESGIPAISPMDCVESHNVSSSSETLPHYHQASDTTDTLHLPFTTKVAQVMVATVATWGEPVSAP